MASYSDRPLCTQPIHALRGLKVKKFSTSTFSSLANFYKTGNRRPFYAALDETDELDRVLNLVEFPRPVEVRSRIGGIPNSRPIGPRVPYLA